VGMSVIWVAVESRSNIRLLRQLSSLPRTGVDLVARSLTSSALTGARLIIDDVQ
jgi:hypothetical protein